MGLAFGSPPNTLGFGAELVSANGVLAKLGVPPVHAEEPVAAGAGAPGKKHRPKQAGLPMPAMPADEEGQR
jgi:hypothetical protein